MDNFDNIDIKEGSGIVPYQQYTYTLGVGAGIDIDSVYSYLRVISKSGGELSVIFGGVGSVTKIEGAGLGINLPKTYSRLRLINTGSTSMTLTVALGLGIINDDRLTISTALSTKDVGSTLTSIADFTTSTTAALAVPANASRKEVMITNNSSSIIVYLGDSNINNSTRKGLKLDPLATAIINNSANIYAVSASGNPTLSILSSEY